MRKTQVAIIGAGPAGLLLGHLLRKAEIDCVILERQSPDYVLARIRAGVLEAGTIELLARLGLDARLRREGMPHDGLTIVDNGAVIPIPIRALTGKCVTVYGQTEITRDLIDAAPERGLDIIWNAGNVALHDVTSATPSVSWTASGTTHHLACGVIAGCDGSHGVSRTMLPDGIAKSYTADYPFGWLGILANVPPCHHEVIYASHNRGFALASMRSPTRSRYYVQVPITERLEDWPDDRVWDELCLRLGSGFAANVTRGPSIEKSIAPLRSVVCEPMRHGNLFLAGDAAHIVPPTGAKGLNLAASDVAYLGEALVAKLNHGVDAGIDGYSARALARIWKTERFSWYMTKLLHRFPHDSPFERRMQDAELAYLAESEAARMVIAQNYVGLPL